MLQPLSGHQSSLLGPIPPAYNVTPQKPHSLKPTGASLCSTGTAPFRDGLPTPPGDMTGVAYNAMPPMAYGGKSHGMPSHLYTHTRPHVDGISSSMVAAMQPQNLHVAPTNEVQASESVRKKSTGTMTGLKSSIPSFLNSGKGRLAEFAAQMTCLFWFEKTSKLQAIEDRKYPAPSLVPEAIPAVGFQKWVATLLSTTQVSQNVILLALLFIYRLKRFNSSVKGKKGSEFRLMTVALMLGNKFLDDNTYTNKTWAEVSGIAVQEIHVMEVEFLSNIRYDLFASEAEWDQWHTKLDLFGDYFNQASMLPVETKTPIPALQVSPPSYGHQSPTKLPSPPSDTLRPSAQPNWFMPVPGLPYPVSAQDAPTGAPRKRSREDEPELQPMKRVARGTGNPILNIPSTAMNTIPTLPPVVTPTSAPVAQAPIAGSLSLLPPPNLPPTSNPMHQSLPSTSVTHLPVPATMPAVYNRPSNWAQQMPPATLPPVASGLYNTPRHQSPYSVSTSTISPAISAYSVHTPQTHLSPSFFLANRNSPYRPVRSVHTLLIPPPSTSLHQQRSVPFDHMHYQPLSKGVADRKTGLLPYIQPEVWNSASHTPFYSSSQTFSG